ncbi:MAG: hypothetical protein P1P76_02410 [Anaerolineales bacterium]|nr:hypothetical protein [Anaerolineales bacterium]
MKDRRNWLTWFGILIAVLALVAAAALVLMPASAGGFPFSWVIRSNLSADYRYGETAASLGAFRVSIIGDVLRDMGIGDKEASQRENVMKVVMEGSVPTATAFDYEGNPPLTATPTETATPTSTPMPTSTSTNTPRPTATKTPQPSATKTSPPAPTKTPKPPTAITDTKDPVILATSLSPSPGPDLDQCDILLSVDVKDPAYSDGVDSVEAKHSIVSGTPGPYNYFTFSGTGSYDAGANWVGSFSGTIEVSDVSEKESFNIFFRVKDNAGNQTSWTGPFAYTLASEINCD